MLMGCWVWRWWFAMLRAISSVMHYSYPHLPAFIVCTWSLFPSLFMSSCVAWRHSSNVTALLSQNRQLLVQGPDPSANSSSRVWAVAAGKGLPVCCGERRLRQRQTSADRSRDLFQNQHQLHRPFGADCSVDWHWEWEPWNHRVAAQL